MNTYIVGGSVNTMLLFLNIHTKAESYFVDINSVVIHWLSASPGFIYNSTQSYLETSMSELI